MFMATKYIRVVSQFDELLLIKLHDHVVNLCLHICSAYHQQIELYCSLTWVVALTHNITQSFGQMLLQDYVTKWNH